MKITKCVTGAKEVRRFGRRAEGSGQDGEQAIGRSRGGLTTKIHVLVDALGNPVDLMLTPGQAHDLTCAEPLLGEANPRSSDWRQGVRRRSAARYSRPARNHPGDSSESHSQDAADL